MKCPECGATTHAEPGYACTQEKMFGDMGVACLSHEGESITVYRVGCCPDSVGP